MTVRNGEVELAYTLSEEGLCVRVLVDGSFGFASVNAPTRGETRETVSRAIKLAKGAKRRNPILLAEVKAEKARWRGKEKQKLSAVSVEEMVKALREVDAAAQETGPKLPTRLCSLDFKQVERAYSNSEGTDVQGHSPRWGIHFFLSGVEGGKSLQSYKYFGYTGGWEGFEKLGVLANTRELARGMKRNLREGKELPPGKMDVVAGPNLSGIASHESSGHPMEADRILGREAAQAGKTFVSQGMLGKRIGSDLVNIIDDPTLPSSFGFYEFDEEGVRAQKRYLYKGGKINEFLLNRQSAQEMGLPPNGAARAVGYDRESIVRMSNTYVEPGDWDAQEIIEATRSGLYLKSYTEWNIDDRRYNQKYTGMEAYLIRDGEVTSPVRNPVLELTTPAFWGAVDAVGKDLEFDAGTCGKGDPMQGCDVWFGGPTIRLHNVRMR